MKLSFPGVNLSETHKNQAKIDISSFGINDIAIETNPKNTIQYQIVYPCAAHAYWYYQADNTSAYIALEEKVFRIQTIGHVRNPWFPGLRWRLRIFANMPELLMQIYRLENNNKYILHQERISQMSGGPGDEYYVHIFPNTELRETVYIQFIDSSGAIVENNQVEIWIEDDKHDILTYKQISRGKIELDYDKYEDKGNEKVKFQVTGDLYGENDRELRFQIYTINNEAEEVLYETAVPKLEKETNKFSFNISLDIEEIKPVYVKFVDIKNEEVEINNKNNILIKYNEISWYYGYEEHILLNYISTSKTGDAKFELRTIVRDENGKMLDSKNTPTEGLECTGSQIRYLLYHPSIEEEPFDTIIYLEGNNNIPIKEVYNRENLKFNWRETRYTPEQTQLYQYQIIPYMIRDGQNKIISMDNRKINPHLEKYRVKSPVFVAGEGEEARVNGFDGVIYSNYAPNPDIAFGLPLPVDISNKNSDSILVWDGTVAKEFSEGNGSSISPFIIRSPEEFAKMVYDKNENNNNYYYEVDPACYAFDMNGMSNINIYEKQYVDLNTNKPNKIWSPNNVFMGQVQGNGIIIYNLYATTGGLFNQVKGDVDIQGIILKNSYITHSTKNGMIEYAVGGIIGSHTNEAINYSKKIILSKCAVIQTYFNHSVVEAPLLGNARFSNKVDVELCCCYFNKFSGAQVSSGGFIGVFQSGNDTGGKIVDITHCIVLGEQMYPRGELYFSDYAHQGWCLKQVPTQWGWHFEQCDRLGRTVSEDKIDPNTLPVQFNANSKSYHFIDHMNIEACYGDKQYGKGQGKSPYEEDYFTTDFNELKKNKNITSQLWHNFDTSLFTEENVSLLAKLAVFRGQSMQSLGFEYVYDKTTKTYTYEINNHTYLDFNRLHQSATYLDTVNNILNLNKLYGFYFPDTSYKPISDQEKYFNINLQKSDLGQGYSQANDLIYVCIRGYEKDIENKVDEQVYYGVPYRYSNEQQTTVAIETITEPVQIKNTPTFYLQPQYYSSYRANKAQSYVKHIVNEETGEYEYRPIYKIYIKTEDGYKEAF